MAFFAWTNIRHRLHIFYDQEFKYRMKSNDCAATQMADDALFDERMRLTSVQYKEEDEIRSTSCHLNSLRTIENKSHVN